MEKKKYVYGQSGVQGFFGKTTLLEYWYQLIYFFVPGYNFKHMVFVSKTATLKPRVGNTKLGSEFKIRSFLSSSIWVSLKSFWHGYMLNAVGLSNPGFEYLLKYGEWQKRTNEHFHISIQLESITWPDTVEEIRKISTLLQKYLPISKYSYDIQLNESCPNTGHSIEIDKNKLEDTKNRLQFFHHLLPNTKIWVKYNALIATDVLRFLKPYCEGFVISNTIPFGSDCTINWKKWFKNGSSPLPKQLGKTGDEAKKFEGGLSGSIIFPIVKRKIIDIQLADPTLKIIVGGGIMTKKDVNTVLQFSIVKGITLGTVAVLRPGRVNSLTTYANKKFAAKENV